MELIQKLRSSGFEIEKTWYFNLIGIVGWWVNGVLLRRKVIPKYQLVFINLLVPILRWERFLKIPFGLSLIAIAKKPIS